VCLITWNWQPGTDQPLLLIANRDEYYARPTLPMHWWDDGKVLAGKDLTGGGTWLGVTRDGRMAALTNYRDPDNFRADAPSRGMLVSDFFMGQMSAADYLHAVCAVAAKYNAFNLLVFDGSNFMGLESRHGRVFSMQAGIGGVSNADFASPWPKLEKMRAGLARVEELAEGTQESYLWGLMGDGLKAPDDQLPVTGIPLERERELSSAFIVTPDYGTRASTLLRTQPQGFLIAERRYDHTGLVGTSQFTR
jgi:uncharacterized protein with NRDE domain